eukprot:364035-Chlamydomonas_euryale.AAC.6
MLSSCGHDRNKMRRTDGRTHARTEGQTDGWADGTDGIDKQKRKRTQLHCCCADAAVPSPHLWDVVLSEQLRQHLEYDVLVDAEVEPSSHAVDQHGAHHVAALVLVVFFLHVL